MKDPQYPSNRFLLDRPVSSERLLGIDSLAHMSGASISGDAVGFSSPRSLTVELPLPSSDLSSFDRLSILIKNISSGPLLAGLTLFHGPEDEDSLSRAVSFTGGRELLSPGTWANLRFPAESFGSYFAPQQWTDVQRAELRIGREKTDQSTAPIEVLIQCVDAESREIPPGPRLTLEGLAGVLQRDVEGITGFHEVSRRYSGEMVSDRVSELRLMPYTAGNRALMIPAPHPYPMESADLIMAGHIMGQQVAEPVQWDADPLGIQEWTHFLNRHHFMKTLVRALASTGEERYAQALDRMIAHWITVNPVPVDSNGGAGPSWETLSAAWRLREWLWVAGIAWKHQSFRNDTRVMMLCSIWEHARSLMDHLGHPNNWIIVESAALALAGMCFPQFHESSAWAENGIERLRKELQSQFFPDGAHFELSPLYHGICLYALMEVKEGAQSRNIPLPHEFNRPLERSAEYLAALYRPDFTWPSLNDSGGATGDYAPLIGKAAELFDRPDFAWIASQGRKGSEPKWKSRVFPDSGIAVMRSAHARDANQLVFRAGPAGATHVHDDVLSLDVTALGMPRLADPGITTYAPDTLSQCHRSTGAHNSILINGKGAVRASLKFSERIRPAGNAFSHYVSGPLEAATGLYRGPWEREEIDVTVARTVLFVHGEYWIVRDVILGSGEHEVTACWQFFPGRQEIDLKTYAVRCMDARGPMFELWPISAKKDPEIEVYTGATHPPRGWISINGADYPATNCRFNYATPLPFTMLWLLLPYRGAATSGIATNVRFNLKDEDTAGQASSATPAFDVTRSFSNRFETRLDIKEQATHFLELRFPAGHIDRIAMCHPLDQENGQLQPYPARHGRITFSRERTGKVVSSAAIP